VNGQPLGHTRSGSADDALAATVETHATAALTAAAAKAALTIRLVLVLERITDPFVASVRSRRPRGRERDDCALRPLRSVFFTSHFSRRGRLGSTTRSMCGAARYYIRLEV
jgi:hypothetical protein